MYETYTQERIAALKRQRGLTARDLSLSLGQNDSYINRIENNKALPSLEMLFAICDFFNITPMEFFDEGNPHPEILNEIIGDMKLLDERALTHLAGLVKEMAAKKK